MAQLAQEAAAAGGAAAEAGAEAAASGSGRLRRALSALLDLSVAGGVGLAGVAGYYYIKYDLQVGAGMHCIVS